ncbi:hypothetical protein [Phytoactinopolyspora halotolerans]|uniref:Uncharacterized protein n=1 Tax=Phytoactinopolyspora halotolerans TaxID=1981512 RepID=A0A6L9S9H7_9ACTN|nr:hypothetical protein [Phytoactinopolyspora halotolerans]NEE02035.1 hypothetical protein [Phytoactinopolyspora halotolerans]
MFPPRLPGHLEEVPDGYRINRRSRERGGLTVLRSPEAAFGTAVLAARAFSRGR